MSSFGGVAPLKDLAARLRIESATRIADGHANHRLITYGFRPGLQLNSPGARGTSLDRFVGVQDDVAEDLQKTYPVSFHTVAGQAFRYADFDIRMIHCRHDQHCLVDQFGNVQLLHDRRDVGVSFLVRKNGFDLARLPGDDAEFTAGLAEGFLDAVKG